MPKFAYKAIDSAGVEQYGVLDAATEADAVNEGGTALRDSMKQPPRSLRSLPPEGAGQSLGTARRDWMKRPPRSLRSLPPGGAGHSLGTAHRD